MNKEAKPKIVVTQNSDKESVPAHILADAIVEVAKGMKALTATRLRKRTIVTLLHENTKVGRRDIEIILDNLETLEEDWLKP